MRFGFMFGQCLHAIRCTRLSDADYFPTWNVHLQMCFVDAMEAKSKVTACLFNRIVVLITSGADTLVANICSCMFSIGHRLRRFVALSDVGFGRSGPYSGRAPLLACLNRFLYLE